MTSDTSNALNAIGTLIGYIGTEVATDDFFDRLLWPRRAYNGFTWKHVPKMMLLMPMGGPLHKAALSTLDDFYKHGLYERHQQGHMLGTAFFRDLKLKYRAYSSNPGWENEYVRNGLLVRALVKMRFPLLERKHCGKEGGDVPEPTQKVRQKICVSHLTLKRMPARQMRSKKEVILDDASPPTLRTYLAHFTTEFSAIVTTVIVAVLWRSAFAALWLLPLALKLISTFFTVSREKLEVPSLPKRSQASTRSLAARTQPQVTEEIEEEEEVKLFGIRNPAGGFVIVEAPDSLALQFFRHYGHPVRSKNREILQIGIVVAFTLVFPIGLVCSTLWMSDALQKMWVGYQLYATMAMYVYRYAGGHLWGTTEEQIGDAFFQAESAGTESIIILKARDGEGIVTKMVRTCHGRFGEALAHVEQMINAHQNAQPSRCGLMTADRTSSDLSGKSSGSDQTRCTEGWD